MKAPPAVEIRGLRYRYHDGVEALRGVDLAVAAGECVALIGPNGAGKSTLLLHLNGILPERHGDAVRIHGEPVVPETLERIRRKVGLLFQDPDDRDACLAALRARGVMAAFHYVPLHSAPHGRGLGAAQDLPVTERVAARLLRLPLHPGLGEGDVERVIDAVRHAAR